MIYMKFRRLLMIVLIVFSILPVLILATMGISSFLDKSINLVTQNIDTTASLQAHNIQTFFEQRQVDIQIMSNLPVIKQFLINSNAHSNLEQSKKQCEETVEFLKVRTDFQKFINRISLINKNNIIIASSSETLIGKPSKLNPKYLPELLNNVPVVSDLYEDNYEGDKKSFIIAHPIFINDQFEGFMMFAMNTEYLQTLAENSMFLKSGRITIVDGKGYIAATGSKKDSKNIKDVSDKSNLAKQFQKEVEYNGEDGRFEYYIDDLKKVAYYSKIAGSGWFVLSTVEASEFMIPKEEIQKFILLTVALLVIFTLLLYMFINCYFSRPLNRLMYVIKKIKDGNYQERVKFEDTSEIGEIGRAFNELMDTISKNNKELALKEERYRIVSEQADTVIFEYDMLNHTFVFTSNFLSTFGYEPQANFLSMPLREQFIYEEDGEIVERMIHDIISGKKNSTGEIRIKKKNDIYIWCEVAVTAILDENNRLVRVIGKISDINKRKQHTKKLELQAQKDLLTKLYNKKYTEKMISEILKKSKEEDEHILIVADIDNFKKVNDTHGHLVGDQLLYDFATKAKTIFRKTDIIGRIGGDEFIIFMPYFKNQEKLGKKMTLLMETFKEYGGENKLDILVTCSIGVAIYPHHGTTFSQLYVNADNALYETKRKGKDGFTLYGKIV